MSAAAVWAFCATGALAQTDIEFIQWWEPEMPAGALRDEAQALAARIAARSALSVQLGKRTFHRQAGLPLAEAYEVAAAAMVENLLAEDAAEGIGAFLARRTPEWRHR